MKYTFLRFPEGKTKAVTFSYDDGVKADLRLADTLTKYGLKGTFNLNSCNFNTQKHLTIDEIKSHMLDAGHEIAVHGEFHKALGLCSPLEGIKDVLNCRLEIEKTFGKIIRGMAYPYGTHNDDVVRVLADCGIVYARTTKSTGSFDIPTDWLRMPATCHHNDPRLMELAHKFVEDKRLDRPHLFYLWGHTYEFDNNNNWNVIEEFAEYMGGRNDIWYATNIEIYEYIEDFGRLVFSADMRRVKNPTARTLYFHINGKEYAVAAGETTVISE